MAGPSDVYICHLCVALCNEILAQEPAVDRPAAADASGQAQGKGPLIRTEVISS